MFWRRGSAEQGQASSATEGQPSPATEGQPSPSAPETLASGDVVTTPAVASEASLASGLSRTRGGLVARLRSLVGASNDPAAWEEVEEALIAADVGAVLASEIVTRARADHDPAGPEAAVRTALAALLSPRPGTPWTPTRTTPGAPAVVLIVGVNGTGKTTTIAKLAARERRRGQRVLLAAADTFRAAAVEQLQAWARRVDVPIVAHGPGADPSAVVFDALDAAVARHSDVVIVDTAGRLHTKHNLMAELAKIRRTIDKRQPGIVPDVLFVLDATTGQNGLAQAEAFHAATGLTGIVLTKLDSTARGGIVFAIEQTLGVPVLFVGVGEGQDDLLPFDPASFIAALFA